MASRWATTVPGSNLLTNRSRAGSASLRRWSKPRSQRDLPSLPRWQHVGWVGDLDFSSTYAIFSTFNTSNSLYARTSDDTNFLIAGNWAGAHIVTASTTPQPASCLHRRCGSRYLELRSQRRDEGDRQRNRRITASRLGTGYPYAASGLFTSRVLHAGICRPGAVTWTASGSTLSISARSGNTAAPDGTWSAFTPIAASGSSANLTGRYIQYQASLSTANTAQTPVLDVIAFACTSTTVVQGFQAQSLVSAAPITQIATVAPTSTLVPTATVVVLPTRQSSRPTFRPTHRNRLL